MRAVLFSILVLAVAGNNGADAQPLKKFGFQEIALGAIRSQVPQKYLLDCARPKSDESKFIFCRFTTQVGSVPMNVEISFMRERVYQIHAYFPSEHFDSVWLALRERYGRENKRDDAKVEWLTNEREIGKPMPDEIFLIRVPEEVPLTDDTFIRNGVKYSVIEYTSASDVNDKAKIREEEHRRRIKGIADKL